MGGTSEKELHNISVHILSFVLCVLIVNEVIILYIVLKVHGRP